MGMRFRLAVVACLAATLTGCGDGAPGEASPSIPAQTGWERLDDLPLSKRTGPVTVWTGREVIAFGGDPGTPCPPNADCVQTNPMARDGAALDPDTGHWRSLSSAPIGIEPYAPSALVGDHLFVKVREKVLDYDVRRDAWSTLPRTVSDWYDLVADGDRLVLVSGSDEQEVRADLTYDVAKKRWSELPEDPIGPAFDRGMVASPSGLVLTAKKLVPNPGAGDQPSFVLAAMLDPKSGQWRRLPDGDLLGGGRTAVVGDRLIMPSPDASNGGGDGAGDYGRLIPFGGVLDLEDDTWHRLPNAPRYLGGGWPVDASGSRLIAAEGYVYDDASGSWLEVPRPPGAAERPGPAVWVGDRLVVVGGTNDELTAEKAYDLSVRSWSPVIGAFQ